MSKFAVGDIVVLSQRMPKNPQAAVNLYVGRDVEVRAIQPNAKGEPLYHVRIFDHMVPPEFWVTEDMLEPEVTDAMAAAGMDAADDIDSKASWTERVAVIYRAMRAVRRDKSKVGGA